MSDPIGAIGSGIRMPGELGAGAGRALSAYRDQAPFATEMAGAGRLDAGGQAGGPGFLDTAREFIDGVNELQQHADGQLRAFVRGEAELHDVAIATHEAGIAMRLTREIRDRLLGAYQEIMRTQM